MDSENVMLILHELFFVVTISNKGTRRKRKMSAKEAGKNNNYLIELYGDVCFNCRNLFRQI